ncbi:MAG: 3'-5' exonuclease domain-containing protein 2 [Desulfobulbus sp.]|nr:3'-5' exonuclease domain-containing protein 2 [Desulfobulbus sp.]
MLVGSGRQGNKDRSIVDTKISKEAINELPLGKWQGPVQLVTTVAEAEQAATELSKTTVLGFDTETRPAFKKGQKFQPSLVQLATAETVYLFQLQSTGLPQSILEILENDAITKAGVAPDFDLQSLQTIVPFSPACFIDLARMARQRGIHNQGLRGLAALICEVRISKSARTTNWAKPELTPQQIQYAATDAWISREIYLRLDLLTL